MFASARHKKELRVNLVDPERCPLVHSRLFYWERSTPCFLSPYGAPLLSCSLPTLSLSLVSPLTLPVSLLCVCVSRRQLLWRSRANVCDDHSSHPVRSASAYGRTKRDLVPRRQIRGRRKKEKNGLHKHHKL